MQLHDAAFTAFHIGFLFTIVFALPLSEAMEKWRIKIHSDQNLLHVSLTWFSVHICAQICVTMNISW